jgi:hypothetical protein
MAHGLKSEVPGPSSFPLCGPTFLLSPRADRWASVMSSVPTRTRPSRCWRGPHVSRPVCEPPCARYRLSITVRYHCLVGPHCQRDPFSRSVRRPGGAKRSAPSSPPPQSRHGAPTSEVFATSWCARCSISVASPAPTRPLLPCSPNPKLTRRRREETACQRAAELLLQSSPPCRCPYPCRYVQGVYHPSVSVVCDSPSHITDQHRGNCSPASRNHREPPLPVVQALGRETLVCTLTIDPLSTPLCVSLGSFKVSAPEWVMALLRRCRHRDLVGGAAGGGRVRPACAGPSIAQSAVQIRRCPPV